MTDDPLLRLYLEAPLLKSARAGEHNFINLISEVAKSAQFRVEYVADSSEIDNSMASPAAYSLYHMARPRKPGDLVFRRSYYYPFWQIDQTDKRWNWDVAKTEFDPATVPSAAAKQFFDFWQRRLFGDLPQHVDRQGYVFVPLQGRLTSHRSFQSCSPIEMIEQTLEHCEGRRVVATLHPKETYSSHEYAGLERLAGQHPQLEIEMGNMEQHLRNCDYVVTQNSSAAFAGFFFNKPALLFAGVDFHHIVAKFDVHDPAAGFAAVAGKNPNFAAYIWWFLQNQSINAGRADAKQKITARFRKFGWPM